MLREAALSPSSFGHSHWDRPDPQQALVREVKVIYGEGLDINVGLDDVALCNWALIAVALAIADPGYEVILPVPW